MQDWLIILIYAIVASFYAVLQQLFFRYRFRDLLFTFGFVTVAGAVVMFATKFNNVFTWITVVNIILLALIGVYMMLCMRMARDKMMRQMSPRGGLEEMLKNVMQGGGINFMGMEDMFGSAQESGKEPEQPDIVVTDLKSEEDEKEGKDADYYDVGDVIIDEKEGEKHDEEKK